MGKEPWEDNYEMNAEYDFSGGVRGKYTTLDRDIRIVTLDEDVHAAFPDSQSVNEALRILIKIARRVKNAPKAS